MVSVRKYNYGDKVMETVIIDKKVHDDLRKVCRDKKLNKSRLVEEFYKAILLRFREGSLNPTNTYITLNVMREPILLKKAKLDEAKPRPSL